MNVIDRYAAVRKQRLCYGCLRKEHSIKDCKANACGINECTKNHNRLQHSENPMDQDNHAVNVTAAKINQINEITSFLKIVPVSIQSGSNTYAFLASGSTISFIDHGVNEKLQAKGTDATAQNISHTRKEKFEDRKGSSPNKGTTFNDAFNRSVCTLVNHLGKYKLQLPWNEPKLQSPECSTQQKLQLDGSWHHTRSRCL